MTRAREASSARRWGRFLLAVVALAVAACGAEPDGPTLVWRLTTETGAPPTEDVAKRAVDVVGKRLAAVESGARVEFQGADELRVRLPRAPEADVAIARELVERPGVLELRLTVPIAKLLAKDPDTLPRGMRRVQHAEPGTEAYGNQGAVLEYPEDLPAGPERDSRVRDEVFTDQDVATAKAVGNGLQWVVQFEMREDRRAPFGDFTGRSINRALAIVADGRVLGAPVIKAPLPGAAVIEGGGAGFTEAEARAFAAVLASGRLPCKLELVREEPAVR